MSTFLTSRTRARSKERGVRRSVHRPRFVAIGAVLGAILAVHVEASAQSAPPAKGVAVGEYWFRPRVEIRLRGEYSHHPVETLGMNTPIWGSGLGLPVPTDHQWAAHERARIRLDVERGILTASVVLQDARLAGYPSALRVEGGGDLPSTSFHAAYIEAHSREVYPSLVRVGRQELAWGEGRLLGTSDWFLVPRSLDAVRARSVVGQFDVEAFAALLTPPGTVPPQYARQSSTASAGGGATGPGVQLFGVSGAGHFDPLLHVEIAGLARLARAPLPMTLTPSDTVVIDGRVFGERAGISYAAEFAYELGRLALVDRRQNIAAWGATAHVDWQSTWLFRPKFSLGGSYATGDDGARTGTLRTFDPILPDARAGLGQMGLYGWSNILEGAFTVAASPLDELSVTLGYRHVRLADPHGAWFSASLAPVGQNAQNESAFLGHEIDAALGYSPIEGLTLRGGYGALITGEGARAILAGKADKGPRLLSAAFLQVALQAP